jgi:hypothetical protein
MIREFTGLSQAFNVAVLRMAELVTPGYGVTMDESEAPDTLEKLNAYIAQHKRMLVWGGASDHTIFGSAEVNWAFRSWHDWTHWRYQTPFTPQGEIETAERQCEDLLKVYGDCSQTREFIKLIRAEIVGQTRHFVQHGCFPTDQVAFVKAYLGNPEAALSAGPH